MRVPSPARVLAGAHASYLVGTGLWAVVHRRSFEQVTGRKRDFWLVRLVGGLAAVDGIALGVAVARGRPSPEARTLALGSAVTFGLADVYAARNVSRVYLGDILVQLAFAAGWIASWERGLAKADEIDVPVPAGEQPTPAVDDEQLAATVRETLEPGASVIDVEVQRGVVTLRGSVESPELVDELVRRVESVPDVRGIDPHLAVDKPSR